MSRKDELIACAKTIIANADSIVGTEEQKGDLTVTISFCYDEAV